MIMSAASIIDHEYTIPEMGDCRVFHADKYRVCVEKVTDRKVFKSFEADDFYSFVDSKIIRPKPSVNDEFQLSEKMYREIDKREPVLSALKTLKDGGCAPTSAKTYERLCKYLKAEYGDSYRIYAKSTVSQWWRSFQKAFFCVARSLYKGGIKTKRLTEHQENLIFKHLENTFLTDKSQCRTVKGAYRDYQNDPTLKDDPALKEDPKLETGPVSYSTFNRRWLEITDIIKTLSPNTSEQEKRRAFYKLKGKFVLNHILERVEIDATVYDLSLIDENGDVTEKVQIFAAIDCYSRYPLAIIIKFGSGESSEDYQKLLREMVFGTRAGLKANGIPFTIIADNGPGTKSLTTREVMRNAKIDYKTLPPHTPWGKGFVERFFWAFETGFLQEQPYSYINKKGLKVHGKGVPGYRCSADKGNGEKPYKLRAAITIAEFERRMDLYLKHYVNEPKNGLNGRTPQQVWNESSADLNFTNNIADEAQFNHAFMLPHDGKSRQIYKDGSVYFDNSYYTHPDLQRLRNDLKDGTSEKVMVNIHYSIFDVRTIKLVAQSPDGDGYVVMYLKRLNSLDLEDAVPYGTSTPEKVVELPQEEVEGERPITVAQRKKEKKAEENAKKGKSKTKTKRKKTKRQSGVEVPVHNLDKHPHVDLAKLLKDGNKHLPRTVFDEDEDLDQDDEEENELQMKIYTKDDQADLFGLLTDNEPDLPNENDDTSPKKWTRK